ncbi:MAG: hypothetical protein QME41_09140 [Actinomycetota bacterium]|nr:hypothetical protein [Actinomycetota bacterium]
MIRECTERDFEDTYAITLYAIVHQWLLPIPIILQSDSFVSLAT